MALTAAAATVCPVVMSLAAAVDGDSDLQPAVVFSLAGAVAVAAIALHART